MSVPWSGRGQRSGKNGHSDIFSAHDPRNQYLEMDPEFDPREKEGKKELDFQGVRA